MPRAGGGSAKNMIFLITLSEQQIGFCEYFSCLRYFELSNPLVGHFYQNILGVKLQRPQTHIRDTRDHQKACGVGSNMCLQLNMCSSSGLLDFLGRVA